MAIEGDAGVTVTDANVGVALGFVLAVDPPPQLARRTQTVASRVKERTRR